MATRLWIPLSGTPPLPSLAYHADWNRTVDATRLPFSHTKGSTTTTQLQVSTGEATDPFNVAHYQVQSEPLSGSGTLSGTVLCWSHARESGTGADACPQIIIRVVSGDGSTVRGVALASQTFTTVTEEFGTAAAGRTRRFPATTLSNTLTSVAYQAGDRIIVELGCRQIGAGATTTAGFWIGESLADVAATFDNGVAGSPWVEFSQDLTFGAPAGQTGTASGSYTLTATAAGVPTKLGTAAAGLTLTATAAGTVSGVKTGQAAAALTLTGHAAGVVVRIGNTRPSSVFGGGFQNAGCMAPAGVGHEWFAVSGGDVGGFAVTVDGWSWKPANTNLLVRNQQRVSCVEGSRTTANLIYAYTCSNDGTGSQGGYLIRGTFQPDTGLIDWETVAQFSQGAQAGNVGRNHPRQVGRTMALDEANDVAVIGTINGLAVITLSTGTVTYRALAGHHVTGVVLDPTNTQLCYCTVDIDGGAGQAGVHRVVNIRSGTVSSTRHTGLTDPQDIMLATVAGTRYCWVAAHREGVWRWVVSADITAGWTDLTGPLPVSQGWAGIDVAAGAALSSTKVLATTADSAAVSVDAGAWSDDGGATWRRESTSWTISTVPAGLTEPWWLEQAQAPALLNGNTYESACPRLNPDDPNTAHIHGRSGVWQTYDGCVNVWPSVYGHCWTGGIVVAADPTNPSRVVFGDNDWALFRSTDRFAGMPSQEELAGENARSAFGFDFHPSGGLAIATAAAPASILGEVYTTSDPWAEPLVLTAEGFAGPTGAVRGRAVAWGENASAQRVLIAAFEGIGLWRKVGTGTPTQVSSSFPVSSANATRPRLIWPGHSGPNVYGSADDGLWRSTDYGATWTRIWSYTQTYDQCGSIAADPADPTILYLTAALAANPGLYKVTNASGTPTQTRVGPAMNPPGQVAVDPTVGRVYVCTSMDTAGLGPKLYRSAEDQPGASTVFEDVTDDQWAAGVMEPRDMAIGVDGTLYVANAIGGYFVFADRIGEATAALTLTALAAGVPTKLAAAAATLTLTGAAAGVPVHPGQASAALTLTALAAGQVIGWGAPTNLQATAVSANRIDLTWDPVPGASAYDIERNGVVVAVGVAGTSHNDTGLTPNTLYTYRVAAVR